MSAEVTLVGYACPLCGNRVTVIRSSDHLTYPVHDIVSECECGFVRSVAVDQIQSLEVWKEPAIEEQILAAKEPG